MGVVDRRSSSLVVGCVILMLGVIVIPPVGASTPNPPPPPSPVDVNSAVHHDVSPPLWSLGAAQATSSLTFPAKPVRAGGPVSVSSQAASGPKNTA